MKLKFKVKKRTHEECEHDTGVIHSLETPPEVRDMAIKTWINACQVNPEKLKFPPLLMTSKKYGSELLTSNINHQAVENAV